MCDPVFCEYSNQQVGLSTSFSYRYSYCFERWVGPNYLLPFQVSTDLFVLGCKVELLRFIPFLWVKPDSNSKFQTTSGHIWALTYSILHSCSVNTCNRSFNHFRIQQSCSLPFNNLKELRIIDQWSTTPDISIPLIQSTTILIKSIFPSRCHDQP